MEIGSPIASLGLGFKVDEHRTKLVGSKGSVVIAIGDFVTIELAGIDEDQHRIFGWILDAKAKDGKGKSFSFQPNKSTRTNDLFDKTKRPLARSGKSGRPWSSKKEKQKDRSSSHHKKGRKKKR